MKKKPARPFIPVERRETVRHNIISLLQSRTFSAKELSPLVSASERDVYAHLQHIQRTLNKKEMTLSIGPAQCRKCGFLFKKREKIRKPGRCPICHGENIKEPRFTIEKRHSDQ